MFTEKIYREYFFEIYRKEKQVIGSLCCTLEQISNDRMRKTLIWHIQQETRHAALMEGLVKLLSTTDFQAGEEISIIGLFQNKNVEVANISTFSSLEKRPNIDYHKVFNEEKVNKSEETEEMYA